MLSDERIRQIAEDIYCSEGTRAEIEHSIRAALAEAAQAQVVAQFQPGERGTHGVLVPVDELDSLRKDAERYRWLRSSSVGPHELFQSCLVDLGCGLQTMKSELDLDEAIDAAIAQGKGE